MFKNNRVEKFSDSNPDFSSNVTYKMLKCDSPCLEYTAGDGSKYGLCTVTNENGGTMDRYCLSKTEIDDTCLFNKFSSESDICPISQDEADKLNNVNLFKEFQKRKKKKCTNNDDCVGQGICENNSCSIIPCKEHKDCSIGDVRVGFCVDRRYCKNYDKDDFDINGPNGRNVNGDNCNTIYTDEECRNTKGQNNKCLKTWHRNGFSHKCRSEKYYNKIKEKENNDCFVNYSICGNEMKCEPSSTNQNIGKCIFW